jgi:hypothetical protein
MREARKTSIAATVEPHGTCTNAMLLPSGSVTVACARRPRPPANLPQHLAPLDGDEVRGPAKEAPAELGCGLEVRHGDPRHHLVTITRCYGSEG